MFNSELFEKISIRLKDKLSFLDDKPEESEESTIKALWLAATGINVSAEKAINLSLPDLNDEQIIRLNELIDLRLNNIPLAHITKRQSFMGLEFIADSRALIPRKETEILGKKALELSLDISGKIDLVKVIDVCCGSGNLGIAIAHFNPKCKVYSADISKEAVQLAGENVKMLNLENRVFVTESDLFSGFESDSFFENSDLIVCNPPYISSSKVTKMNPEIAAFEPSLAFDGGMLGFKIIQKLIGESPRFLKPGGWLIFEVGAGQGEFVFKMIEKTKAYQLIESEKDNLGNIRVLLAQKHLN